LRLPILIIHICAGVLGVLSGAAAMSFRKGSRRHRLAGHVFFVAMLVMGSSAAYLGNVFGGLFAGYLATTAWLTARHREGETSILDWAAMLVGVVIGVVTIIHAVRLASGAVAPTPGVPVGMIFFVGFVVLLAAAGDVRLLVRGGVFGSQRIVRHLWRMCFSFFIATGSFFIGQPQVFPAFIRQTNLLFVLGILPLILMIFWFFRVRFTKVYVATVQKTRAKI
jgi:hypothetical protein